MAALLKRLMPKSLLGRSLMIIVSPLILLQVISALIFFESHWDKVTLRLARGVSGDISSVIALMNRFPGDDQLPWIRDHADRNLNMRVSVRPGEILKNTRQSGGDTLEAMLIEALTDTLRRPFHIDAESFERDVIIDVQLANGVLHVVTPRKRLFSSTTYVFVLWMIGSSLILFAVAMIFMRNQVKPIRRLATAADDFGKGRHVDRFKPEGATEVRQAASAFLAMRDRILRQIGQRTDMLTGVSHDLRTPLTRMRLQLEMLGGQDGVDDLKQDVAEMERMLEGYLAFARGEGDEKPQIANLSELVQNVVAQARRRGKAIDVHTEGPLEIQLKPNAFSRALTNLIDNATRYAEHISVRAGRRDDSIEVTIDDDGPGIPEDQRDKVFRPFYRIERSRNPETGGIGLGMAIARDVVQGHGGEIGLADSPIGGLRVRIRLPL